MIKRGKILTVLLIGIFCGILTANAGSMLFENNKTDYKICIPAASGKIGQYSADELAGMLEKISGIKFPIVKSDTIPKGKVIVIADISDKLIDGAKKNFKLKKGIDDAVEIKTIGNILYLVGSNRRSATYAVYSFLEKALDTHFFWAGPTGEFYPDLKKFELPELNYYHKASFRYRELSLVNWHLHAPSEIFLFRNYANSGMRTKSVYTKLGSIRTLGAHSVGIHKKLFAEHPDWFCMIDGKRSPQGDAGCWSNPEFLNYMVKRHVSLAKKNELNIFNIFPADAVLRCECPECKKITNKSERWFAFFKKLTSELKKQVPDTKFASLAYQEYRNLPINPVKNAEFIEYCMYNRCYVHKLEDPKCRLNKKALKELKQWTKKANMGIYGYEFDATGKRRMYPFWNMIADEMKVFKKLGLVRIKTEYPVIFKEKDKPEDHLSFRLRLSAYLYCRLMWDADADLNQLLSDYCRVIFGPGAKAMKLYFDAMAKSWDSSKRHLSYFGGSSVGVAGHFMNLKLIKKSQACFVKAKKAILLLPDSARRKRMLSELEMERKFFLMWKKDYQQAKGSAAPLSVPLLKDANEAQKRASFVRMTPEKPDSPKAEFKVWSDYKNLYFEIISFEPDMSKFSRGNSERDGKLWANEHIEIFLDFNAGYRHFAINPAGGKYDALISDKTWNSKWIAKTEVNKDNWKVFLTIPFKDLGVKPEKNMSGLLIVNSLRTGFRSASGWPRKAHHDMASAGIITFSAKANVSKNAVWIMKEVNRNFYPDFLKEGWNIDIIDLKQAANYDFSKTSFIICDYDWRTKLSQKTWEKSLIPAIKNGAVMMVSAYGSPRFQKYFSDPDLKVTWGERYLARTRSTTFRSKEYDFDKKPNSMKRALSITPPAVFVPACPEKWLVLAKQKVVDTPKMKAWLKKYNWTGDLHMPYLMATPVGKGMLVLIGVTTYGRNIKYNAMLMENLQELNKNIIRKK